MKRVVMLLIVPILCWQTQAWAQQKQPDFGPLDEGGMPRCLIELNPGREDPGWLVNSRTPYSVWAAPKRVRQAFNVAAWRSYPPRAFPERGRYIFIWEGGTWGGNLANNDARPTSTELSPALASLWVRNVDTEPVWLIVNPLPPGCGGAAPVPPPPGPPPHVPPPPVGGSALCATSRTVFDNNNVDGVYNGPTQQTTFRIDGRHVITQVLTYHWNDGRGTASPGILGLRDANGVIYGPWPTSGRSGQGGVPNAYWVAEPNVVLPAGTYTVADSDPGTWAHNTRSNSSGIAHIEGCPADARTAPPPTPSVSPGSGTITVIVSKVNPDNSNPFSEDIVIPVAGAQVSLEFLDKGQAGHRNDVADKAGVVVFHVPFDVVATVVYGNERKEITCTRERPAQTVGFGGLKVKTVETIKK